MGKGKEQSPPPSFTHFQHSLAGTYPQPSRPEGTSTQRKLMEIYRDRPGITTDPFGRRPVAAQEIETIIKPRRQ